MTRGRGNHRDPAVSWIADRDRKVIFDQLASLLSPEEWYVLKRYYGLDGEPAASFGEIGDQLEGSVLGRGYDRAFNAWLSARQIIVGNPQVQAMVLDLPSRPKVPRSLEEAGVVLCDVPGHGYSAIEGVVCKGCDCRIEHKPQKGRSAEYCSASCRQRAYRQRRKKSLG